MESRKMGPLPSHHPMVVEPTSCTACKMDFKEGDYVTLIPLGPGADPEEQEKCRTGRPFNAVAVSIHWACATGEE